MNLARLKLVHPVQIGKNDRVRQEFLADSFTLTFDASLGVVWVLAQPSVEELEPARVGIPLANVTLFVPAMAAPSPAPAPRPKQR